MIVLKTKFALHIPALFFCISLLMSSGCGGGPRSENENLLIYARGGDAVTLDPGSMEDGFSSQVATQIFEGLVRFKEDSMEVEPCLATSWEPAEDNVTWTFHLREGVKFHDGTPFTAESVVLSFMRMADAQHPYHMPGRMPYASFVYEGIIKEVRAVDDHTVQIILHRSYAPLLQNLAMFCCFILSPKSLEQHGENIGMHPVGTGPFKFDSWSRDVEIRLSRFDDYWGDKAKADGVIFKLIRDPEVRLISLARGEANIMDGIEPQMVGEIKNKPNLTLHRDRGINISYGIINVKAEPFTDIRVRQAVNYAINKKAICDFLFDGLAIPCRGIFPPGIMGYDPESDAYEYNPERARELLKEAGFEKGFDFTLLTYSVPRPYNPMGARLAEVIQSDLSKVGIRAKVQQMEFGTLLDTTLNHNFQVALLGWITDNGDPDNYAYALLAYPENRQQYDNPQFIQLTLDAQAEYDPGRREELYRQAQEVAIEDAPWIFLNHFDAMAVTSDDVQGFRLHPSNMHQLWNVHIGRETNEENTE